MSHFISNLINNHMKKTILFSFMAITSLTAAESATVNSTFSVSVSLVAICTASNSGAATLGFGTYTAFQTGANTGTATLNFSCTRGLATPTFSFDGANNFGVLAGLNYSLAATTVAPTGATAATATTGGTGTADTRVVTVTGTMAGGQAGDCATASAGTCSSTISQNRTLTVAY